MAEASCPHVSFCPLDLRVEAKYDPLNARFDIRMIFEEDGHDSAWEWHTLRGDQLWELKQLLMRHFDDLAIFNEHRYQAPAPTVRLVPSS